MLRAVKLVILAAISTDVSTQQWTRLAPHQAGTGPAQRFNHATVFDSARAEIVFFGGKNADSTAHSNQTWAWTGAAWAQRLPTRSPSRRANHAMAFHSPSQTIVLFGGDDGATTANLFGDTWTWDGTTWTQMTVAASPQRRSRAAMAFDSSRQRVVMFGGDIITNNLNDTWEWNGASWAQSPLQAQPPAARHHHCMAEDATLGRVILFGGTTDRASNNFNDTWEWSGGAWVLRNSGATASPGTRFRAAMAFDGQHITVFGGRVSGTYLNDTWVWNSANGTWTQVATLQRPSSRAGATLTHDAVRGQVLLFAGWREGSPNQAFNDTWNLGSQSGAAATATFGTGCPSASPLTLNASAAPRFGTQITIQSGPFVSGEVSILGAGFSDQHWSGGSLPDSVTVSGVTCNLFVDSIATSVSLPAGATSSLPLAVPANPALQGTTMFLQSAAISSTTFRTSNALMLQVGS